MHDHNATASPALRFRTGARWARQVLVGSLGLWLGGTTASSAWCDDAVWRPAQPHVARKVPAAAEPNSGLVETTAIGSILGTPRALREVRPAAAEAVAAPPLLTSSWESPPMPRASLASRQDPPRPMGSEPLPMPEVGPPALPKATPAPMPPASLPAQPGVVAAPYYSSGPIYVGEMPESMGIEGPCMGDACGLACAPSWGLRSWWGNWCAASMPVGPHGSPSRFWMRFEYLHWALQAADTPPLVTTSSQAVNGILGAGDTRVLFGGEDVGLGGFGGGRVSLGWWFDRGETIGIEGSFFKLREGTTGFYASSQGNPLLARPAYAMGFLDQEGGIVPIDREASQLVAKTNEVAGGVNVDLTSRMLGADFNFRRQLGSGSGPRGWLQFHCDGLLGFRYLRLDEGLFIREDLIAGPEAGNIPAGTAITVRDSFETYNNFYGGQIGFDMEVRLRRWSFNVRPMLALGATNSQVVIDGNTTFILPDAGAVPMTFPGGFLAQTSNIGTYNRTKFAVVPELQLKLGYQVTDRMRLFLGYNVLAWTNVARPGQHVDRIINPIQTPSVAGPGLLTGPARPTFIYNPTTFWAQGLTAGLEYRF